MMRPVLVTTYGEQESTMLAHYEEGTAVAESDKYNLGLEEKKKATNEV